MSPVRTMLRRPRGLVAAGVAGLLIAAGASAPAGAEANNNTSHKLRDAVTAAGVLHHQQAMQDIGTANGGTRVSGTAGFDQSKDYAVSVFRAAGYGVTVQPFQYQTFIDHGQSAVDQVAPAPRQLPHTVLTYSGSGDATAPVATPSEPLGCEAADYAGFPAGSIALVSRGTCTFAIKATNAHNAGAAAVVVYNNGPGALGGSLTSAFTLDIAVTGITQALGNELLTLVPGGLTLHVKTDTFRGQATTYNVFAESRYGDPDNIVMAGAHLDSVNAGPGINDNGSGAAAILEIAKQMRKVHPTNKVRFALWGAEESGLVGARYYINDLRTNHPDLLQKIALYLNFDMISSPNYVRFVYDGDNSAFPVGPGAAEGPPGSDAIEALFHDYFASVSQPSAETPFSGRSDYGPFIEAGVGIPAGGLFTGAEGVKTAAQAELFGGVAGAAYDPCYHQLCDALTYDFAADVDRAAIYAELNADYDMAGNVNLDALEEMSDAVAHAIITYAFDTRSVNGSGKGHPVSPPGQSGSGAAAGGGTDSGGGLHPDDDHEPVL